MASNEKISVIIPVYNTEKYLEKCIRSVMGQTYSNLDIICVNDGSTDGSAEILARLAREDRRIIVVDKDNGGQGDARNAGLDMVSGEWVSFVDSDDTVRPDTYEVAVRALEDGVDMVSWGGRIVMDETAGKPEEDARFITAPYEGILEINPDVIRRLDVDVAVWNKLFRKSVLDRYGIRFEKTCYEDFPFTLKYLFSIRKARYIKDELYNYLRRADSITGETLRRTSKAIDYMTGIGSMLSFASEHNIIWRQRKLLTDLFVCCFDNAMKYTTDDKVDEIAAYSQYLYSEYPILSSGVDMICSQDGQIKFLCKRKTSRYPYFLQAILSVRKEYAGGQPVRVIRLFGKRLCTLRAHETLRHMK